MRESIDNDLVGMDLIQALSEIMKLRNAIRQQRDQKGHDLCWYLPELWDVLPEKIQPKPEVLSVEEFLERCAKFRKELD